MRFIQTCKCHGRRYCVRCFFFTVGFPVEHLLWEKVPVFASVTHWLGL